MFTMKRQLTHLILISISVLLSACIGQQTNQVQPLAGGDYQSRFQFNGHANHPSRLTLSTSLEDIRYSAEVSDFAGKIITTVNDTTLQTMELIIPIGEKRYFVNLATENQNWLDSIELSVNTINAQKPTSNAAYSNISYSVAATHCELWATQDSTVYLYAQPQVTTQAVLILPINISYETDARTLDGWYQLMIEGHTGWVNGNDVQFNGDCATLPVDTMIQPTSTMDALTTAAYDVDRHYFDINANQGGMFANKISYPNGDSVDIIQATLSNMEADRTIGVAITCSGSGIEALRWGHAQNINLGCNDTLALGFTPDATTIQLKVMLPAVNGQQYVDYQLTAMPIAPVDDDQQVFYIDRNQGGAFQQTISYPIGDTSDIITLFSHNLEETSPNNYREYLLVMQCNGNQSESLRWGISTANLGCNNQTMINISYADPVKYITVDMAQIEGQSFVDYTLYVLPLAPIDDTFWFSIDRDNGGIFNETLSAPMGDTSDTIEVIMSNLAPTAPNNFRQMTLTLYCHGFNEGNIRWGLPDNPALGCGQSVSTAFLDSANQQTLEIVALDASIQTYVNYTLVVAPMVHESILKNDSGG